VTTDGPTAWNAPADAGPAAHRQSLAARLRTEPHPAPAPNTPHSPGFRPRPPTRCAIDAPTTGPDIRTGANGSPIRDLGTHERLAEAEAREGLIASAG